jgi:diaminopimelate decarboxylase
MFNQELTHRFENLPTPFYYYDMQRLEDTLEEARESAQQYHYQIHYALKANSNNEILQKISAYGFGADCVSGNEVKQALSCGFVAKDIVYAGVGKTDEEIKFAIESKIACFNCESLEEIEVINGLAEQMNRVVNIALRVNPNLKASTHHYITTGLSENKFGLSQMELELVLQKSAEWKNININGIHAHIGSQITELSVYEKLCFKINHFLDDFKKHHLEIKHINLGGGLGINYEDPDQDHSSLFTELFSIIHKALKVENSQQVHFEFGRSLVGQCGSLISKVLYVKKGVQKQFAILDAGFTELLRPALYNSYHKIENLNTREEQQNYDIVGPICESSDVFGKNVLIPKTKRGDLIAIRSAGAYGEVMASNYNLRNKVQAIYSDPSAS